MCSERVYGNFCGQKTAWSWPVSCGNARSTPPIIYITDYPGFALDSFSVSPLEYPLKPVDEWRLAAALDWDRQQKRPVLRVGGRTISSGQDHLSEYLGRKTAIQTSRQIEHAVPLQIERGIPESGLLPKPFQLSG